jgi:3-oxoacyl-[acyl-carrier-protein] synthase II
MSERFPVAVTGIGVVSPIGIGRTAFWSALRDGRSGIAPVEGLARRSGRPRIAAAVGEFAARELIASPLFRRMDRLSRMAVAASRLAVDDAGLVPDALSGERVGVVFGTAFGDTEDSATHLERVLTRGPAAASPMVFANLVMNAPAGYIAMEFGWTGVNFTVAQAEVTGEQAIALGCELLRSGSADVVLAGGGDELSPVVVDAHHRARALAGQRGGLEWSSPYDVARSGLVLGEGAAMLALEPLERAHRRGATASAVIDDTRSFAVPAPRYDWPSTADAARAPLHELIDGRPIELICGSANSSRRLDACELDLFAGLCSGHTGVGLTSIKGAIGEFGAAGALTVAAACLALREQAIPPLCHLETPEPGTPLRLAAGRAVPTALHGALVCGLARGGAGIALSLRA